MAQKESKLAEEKKGKSVSRRDFIKAAAAGVFAAGFGANIIIPGRARARRKTLKIISWGHFVPGYDKWFDKTFCKEWGEKNDTEVTVNRAAFIGIAAAELKARKGHDLVFFFRPPAAFEEHVIDHREIYQECERKYGKASSLAIKGTYNPRTDKYYGFCPSYVPLPVNYRKDLWDGVIIYPDTWEDVRAGGAKIKKKYGNPVGIGLSPGVTDAELSLWTIMNSFGASIQDKEGNVVVNSKETLEAVKFVRALYEEAMTPEVLYWDNSSNNRSMLQGKGSMTLNPISITRMAENEKITQMSKNIWLARPPLGPVSRMGTVMSSIYGIWSSAQNIEGAKQFLVDYMGHFRNAFLASEFYEFPSFPDTVPDLKELLASDSKADPPDKYKVLEDVQDWAVNFGYPGYANAAIDEISGRFIIEQMFAKTATGKASPEEAIKEAEAKCKGIFAAWREKGLVQTR
jgi:multiple sugar transport system substrate-binding protein